MPIVLIANQNTASASEILTGALRDNNRAILVGEQTFGKGVVQTSLPIGGGHLNITSARYFTPNGYDIEGIGIEPDIFAQLPGGAVVPLSMLNDETDTQLAAALEALAEMISGQNQ
jgi:carboxyl-terminal processing protease